MDQHEAVIYKFPMSETAIALAKTDEAGAVPLAALESSKSDGREFLAATQRNLTLEEAASAAGIQWFQYEIRRLDREAAPLNGAIEPGSTVYADEAAHWDVMHARYETKRINHSEAYSDGAGTSTNQVESFFSRLRRAEIGTHHHIAGPYLAAYAAEMDWREDARRLSNGTQYLMVVKAAAAHPISRQWKGYWQRRRP